MKFSNTALLVFLLFFSSLVFSQKTIVQKTDSAGIYRLTDIVISATRTSTSTLELASSISIIDSAEISNRNAMNTLDLLKNEYGVSFTTQGGPGSLSNVYIRGGSASYTHVLIDGIEMNMTNDPNGLYDFASLSPDNIDRIEVLRGAQSVLYGSDAMAGIINIITKKGSGSPRLTISAEGGSYNTYKANTGFSGSFNNFNFSLSGSRMKSDGFSAANAKYGNSEKDGFKRDNISTIVGYNFSEHIKSHLFARYVNSSADYDQSGIYGDDPTFKFDLEELSFRNETEVKLFESKWTQKIGASFIRNLRKYRYDETPTNPFSSTSLYDGRKFKVDWQNNLILFDDNITSMGAEIEIDEAVSEFNSYSIYGDFISIFPKHDSRTLGFYLQNQFSINNEFFTSAGVRLDNHDKFGTSFTYRIAPAYLFWLTGTKFKATAGTGFKTPSLFYLYDPAFGNPELKPEKNFGWDAGIEQFFWNEGISLGITYFQNNYKDLFGFDENYKTININKAETKGFEVHSTIRPVSGVDVKINYTFTEAKDKSEGVVDDNQKLIRRPEHKIGGYFSYSFSENANANIEAIYVGKTDDIDFSTFPSKRIQLDSYVLLNFAAHYKLYEFLRLNIRVENLLDSDYEEVFGYGTPGFSIYGGISLSIN